MRQKFIVVQSRLKLELENIHKLYEELETRKFLEKTQYRTASLSDQFTLRAIESVLHDFYTSIENMFKIIAKQIDNTIPTDADWHLELIQQMATNISGIRPAAISNKTLQLINEYRGFRHIFRNIYGFNLIAERIERLLDILKPTIESLEKDINEFSNSMNVLLS